MTIQAVPLRPNNDSFKIGLVLSAGTSASLVTDDTPDDDTSWVAGVAGSQYPNSRMWLDLTSPAALTNTQRVKAVRLRARVRMNAADAGRSATVGLDTRWPYDGTGTFGEKMSTANSTTFQAKTGAWRTKPPKSTGTEWTQAILNSIQIFCAWYYSAGNHQNLRVSELYMDVDVRDRIGVSTPTVAGTDSTRPTVSWSATPNADNDLQAWWWVKVFNSNQYGQPGFDENYAKPVWDSTLQQGRAENVNLGIDLQQGVTYKAYLAIAADFNGERWYTNRTEPNTGPGPWVSSAPFTIAAVAPPAPALTVTPQTGVPNYRALLSVSAPTNLLTYDESAFENSLGTWSGINASLVQDSAQAKSGLDSMRVTATAAGTVNAVISSTGADFAKGGLTYTGKLSLRAAATARSCRAELWCYDGSGGGPTVIAGTLAADSTTGWTDYVVTGTVPTTTRTIRLALTIQSAAAAEVHYVDEAYLAVGPAPTSWSPGGLVGETVMVERGTRGDTGLGQYENWLHPQVASAASNLRSPTEGFRISGDSGRDALIYEFTDRNLPAGVGPTDVWGVPDQPTPAGMVHWLVRSAATASLLMGARGNLVQEEDYQAPVVVGSTHVFSFWAWVASGTTQFTPKIDWINDAGTGVVSTTTGSAITLTTTPQQVVVSGICPATASGARGVLTNNTSSATADVYIARLGFGLGTIPVDGRPARGGVRTWNPVRFADLLTSDPFGAQTGQVLSFADYEVPPARPTVWRARVAAVINGLAAASPYSPYVTAYLAAPTEPILLDPLHPESAVTVGIQVGENRKMDEDSGEFHPAGRDDDPVFVRDWVGDTVTWALAVSSQQDLINLERLLRTDNSLLMQRPEGGQQYVRVSSQETSTSWTGVYQVPVTAKYTAAP